MGHSVDNTSIWYHELLDRPVLLFPSLAGEVRAVRGDVAAPLGRPGREAEGGGGGRGGGAGGARRGGAAAGGQAGRAGGEGGRLGLELEPQGKFNLVDFWHWGWLSFI